MDPIAETQKEIEESEKVEALISEFLGSWDDSEPTSAKTLVIGNLRGYTGFLLRKGKLTLSVLFALFAIFAVEANAQTTDCPPDRVCLTVEQARQALIDSDTVKAQAVEIKGQASAIEQYKAEIANLRIELAKMTGDKTGAEQMIVRLNAIVDFMLKNGRTKKYGLINF